jgi:hypothetical protein
MEKFRHWPSFLYMMFKKISCALSLYSMRQWWVDYRQYCICPTVSMVFLHKFVLWVKPA